MKKFLFLIVLGAILPSTLYCQTDSLRCFTVKQQNEIIAKLVHEVELTKENQRLSRIIDKRDSTIASLEGTNADLTAQYEMTSIIHHEEREARLNAEKEANKYKRRTKFWKGSTVVLGLTSIGLYIFK